MGKRGKQRALDVVAELRRRYPKSFGAMVPLALGIHEAVAAENVAFGFGFSDAEISSAIRTHVLSMGYLKAVVSGSTRHGLDGAAVCAIDPAHVEDAKRRLGAGGVESLWRDAGELARLGEILAELGRRYPANIGAYVPLAPSVRRKLMALAAGDDFPFSPHDVDGALWLHCRSRTYLEAVVRCAQCYSVEGLALGEMSAEALRLAKVRLMALKPPRGKRKTLVGVRTTGHSAAGGTSAKRSHLPQARPGAGEGGGARADVAPKRVKEGVEDMRRGAETAKAAGVGKRPVVQNLDVKPRVEGRPLRSLSHGATGVRGDVVGGGKAGRMAFWSAAIENAAKGGAKAGKPSDCGG